MVSLCDAICIRAARELWAYSAIGGIIAKIFFQLFGEAFWTQKQEWLVVQHISKQTKSIPESPETTSFPLKTISTKLNKSQEFQQTDKASSFEILQEILWNQSQRHGLLSFRCAGPLRGLRGQRIQGSESNGRSVDKNYWSNKFYKQNKLKNFLCIFDGTNKPTVETPLFNDTQQTTAKPTSKLLIDYIFHSHAGRVWRWVTSPSREHSRKHTPGTSILAGAFVWL